MIRPICVKCKCQMTRIKSGLRLREVTRSGVAYKVWFADLFKCDTCGYLIYVRSGKEPISAQGDNNFKIKSIDADDYFV